MRNKRQLDILWVWEFASNYSASKDSSLKYIVVGFITLLNIYWFYVETFLFS